METDQQYIHTKIETPGKEAWFMTAVYASPQPQNRSSLWTKLLNIANRTHSPWIVTGDFNEIKDATEKKGGSTIDNRACNRFANWINDSGLIDLGFSGSRFTWKGPLWNGHERVFKRLDRALSNSSWRLLHHEAVVKVLPRTNSDHHPLLITENDGGNLNHNRPFRFELMWTHHPEFDTFLSQTWNNNINNSLLSSLPNIKQELITWNKHIFGNIFKAKRRIMNRLGGIQRCNSYGQNPFLDQLEVNLNKELNEILDKEETFWLQKSREQWIVEGDRNTRFYHTKTIIRRRKNKILKLRNLNGEWIEDDQSLKNHITSFFQNLYKEEVSNCPWVFESITLPNLDPLFCRRMEAPPTVTEIKKALFSIGSTKAPGEDGFPAAFFKHNWNLMKNKIVEFTQTCWAEPTIIKETNATLLALIPKTHHPEFINQFRPIALCNVKYKILAKVIVQRIKPLLNDRISPHQSSFIPGRKIHDNIIIAKEVMHSMRRMRGKKGYMAIKIDFEKAYDRINWNFIQQRLIEFGIPNKLSSIIMEGVRSVNYNVLWNGNKTETFYPTRGIRQGDPLSPYLFVICMDKLSQYIEQGVDEGFWSPFIFRKNGINLSHLMFADDLLLFAEATNEQIENITETMEAFCKVTNLKINTAKSSIVFSKNTDPTTRRNILSQTEFRESKTLGKYLGAMLNNKRKGKENFKTMLERVQGKLKGWKSKCLSIAGRITLAQSVISPSVNFDMQHGKVPKAVCNEIEKLQRNFVWGDTDNKRGLHAVNWKTLCLPKHEGGLGFRKLELMNEAFLLKIIWQLQEQPNTLWAKILLQKYNSSISNSPTTHQITRKSDSDLWKELMKTWPTFLKHAISFIGDGRSTFFWTDNWVEDGGTLENFATHTNLDIHSKVGEWADDNRGWNLTKLSRALPEETVQKIIAQPPPRSNGNEDKRGWKLSEDGDFSIATTYRALANWTTPSKTKWTMIWNWKGPQKAKILIWKLMHDRVFTNQRRSRIFGGSGDCPICENQMESAIHTFRDCAKAATIWNQLIDPNALWDWRNREVHDQGYTRPPNPHREIEKKVKEIREAFDRRMKERIIKQKEERQIKWNPPPQGWITLNTDGSRQNNKAGCGGILRNEDGKWVGGFSYYIGDCTAYRAELWGIDQGLKIAWTLGLKNIIVECDSKAVIATLNSNKNLANHPNALIRNIHNWREKEWNIYFVNIYREGNRCADCLARKSLSLELGLHFWDIPPREVVHILFDDKKGVSLPRIVCS
ncbi:hypothetical protein Ahy_B02g057597 isoform A [Arachis hypogaea]|uniref:Uncharacterized protein n=1 Tax=Arachis hypogaea TaxID=3818 RepID=A0A445ACN2_ARAHY|nr:hypothetical protein Ahy_B02g057597 isoform A [Arachis hypogaea]